MNMPPILLLDGGMGTSLQRPPHNISFDASTPLWSAHLLVSAPDALRAVHAAFAAAGVDLLLTATYQSSLEGFARTPPGYSAAQAAAYMRSAVRLAHDTHSARPDPPPRVALSLGPYGATMTPVAAEYSGLYPAEMDDERALREWHTQRLAVFALDHDTWDAVQYVAFETVRRADEVRAIRGAVADLRLGQDKPWWITGVFPADEPDEADVRAWLRAAVGPTDSPLPRPWGVGLNCTRLENVARIVSVMQDEMGRLGSGFADEWATRSGRPWLVLYPDGTTPGERYDPVTKTWVGAAAPDEAKVARPWSERLGDVLRGVVEQQGDGAWEGIVVGGCCRTGPEEIEALRGVIQRL